MAPRYFSRTDDDGSFSIIDLFTGKSASFEGRELARIPEKMIETGLTIMNEMDEAQRTVLECTESSAAPN
jgi:hypothetical protein